MIVLFGLLLRSQQQIFPLALHQLVHWYNEGDKMRLQNGRKMENELYKLVVMSCLSADSQVSRFSMF